MSGRTVHPLRTWRPRGVAPILIAVAATVGFRAPAARSTPDGYEPSSAALTTAGRTDRAVLDTDSTRHAPTTDSAHRTARTYAGKLSQDSLAKRRDAAAQAPHGRPQDSLAARRGAAAGARHKPRDSAKAHSAPPTSTVVP